MKSTIRNLSCAVFVILSAVSLSAYGANSGGSIGFVASQSGVSLQGSFSDFVSSVNFDPAHPEVGSVKVGVDVRSVGTGTPSADELLRSEDFFDAKTHPQATFDASEFHALDKGHYVAKGTFTLKGHSASVPVTFTTTSDSKGRWFDGSFAITRMTYRVGLGEWSDTSTLDDAVQIKFHIYQEGMPAH